MTCRRTLPPLLSFGEKFHAVTALAVGNPYESFIWELIDILFNHRSLQLSAHRSSSKQV
jgi:hypothetical protein